MGPDKLSSVLNSRIKRNFFDFVNYYRIEEFKWVSKQAASKNITIMGMAWDAGFNSKATFNRVFKKVTGLTPGEYINQTK
jgi:AraC-like DNA-binding protein